MFYVGNLTTFPLIEGAAQVMQINKGGKIKSINGGFTKIVAVVHDQQGSLYVLEDTVGADMPSPDKGQVVKVSPSGNPEILATGLSLPTAMTFGPDGALYVSNRGFGYPAGAGEIVRIAFDH